MGVNQLIQPVEEQENCVVEDVEIINIVMKQAVTANAMKDSITAMESGGIVRQQNLVSHVHRMKIAVLHNVIGMMLEE
jgi:hypothetical protein